MKYFAKYLPIEGEIKEGDYFIEKDTLGNEDILPCLCPLSLVLHDHLVSRKKVKLFLCSRDIQVGDRVFYIGRERSTDAKEYTVERAEYTSDTLGWNYFFNGQYNPLSIVLKVIGEISPDATWVKDGDEFNEEDIKLTTPFNYKKGWQEIYRQGKDRLTDTVKQVRPYSSSFGISRWEILDLQPEDCVYQIKGPCGHFH